MGECDEDRGGDLYDKLAPELIRRLRRGFSYRVKGGQRRFLRIESAFEREEVVHEAFAQFLRQLSRGTYDPSRDPAPYFYQIGVYTALRRNARLSREIPVEDVAQEPDERDAPDDDVIEREKIAQVREAVASLSEKEQAVYRLTYEAGLSQAKVGEALQLSRDQVYRVLVSLRASVAAYLNERGWFDEP